MLIVGFLNVFIIYEVLELLIPLHKCFWFLCLRYIKVLLMCSSSMKLQSFWYVVHLGFGFWLLAFGSIAVG